MNEETAGMPALNDTDDIGEERWNNPSINMWRVFATFISFMVAGAIDGAYGV